MRNRTHKGERTVMGFDVSDRSACFCVLAPGKEKREGKVQLNQAALKRRFGRSTGWLIALEVGTHSPWLADLFQSLGHEVLLANPRQLPLIYASRRKNDRLDAERLARLARFDTDLLYEVEPRSRDQLADLGLLRSRQLLVRLRADVINHVRGKVKPFGERVPTCSAPAFPRKAMDHIPEELRSVVAPLFEILEHLNTQIRNFDREVERVSQEKYPVTARLRQVKGVGPLTALAFVLVIGDPKRFRNSRQVGAYLGLTPRQSDSGDHEPRLRITKHGDVMMRSLLVSAANYVLGPFGPDTDLRRWGERKQDGSKKRAIVGVARRLSVLLHRLWVSGEDYRPLREDAA